MTITANIFAHPIDDSIQWFHEGSLVDPLTDTRFSINNDRRELHINNVEESVLGTYEVVASIGNYSATDSVTVEIPGMGSYNDRILGISMSVVSLKLGNKYKSLYVYAWEVHSALRTACKLDESLGMRLTCSVWFYIPFHRSTHGLCESCW